MATQSPPATLAEAKFLRDELTDVVQRAQSFSGATGCIIATLHEDRLLVCARAGAAPEIGSAIPLAGSLMGRAVQSGRTMRSQAAESEAATDVLAFRPLRVRSLAVIPLGDAQKAVRGAIAVLSENTSAFNNTQMAILRTLADVAAEKIQQQGGAVSAAPKPEPSATGSSSFRSEMSSPAAAASSPTRVRIMPSQPAPGLIVSSSVAESMSDPAAPPQPKAPEVEPLAAAVTPGIKPGVGSKLSSTPPRSEVREKTRSAGEMTAPVKSRVVMPAASAQVSVLSSFDPPPRKRSKLSRLAIPVGIVGTVLIAGALWSYNWRSEVPAPKPVHYVAVPISKEALEKISAAEPAAEQPGGSAENKATAAAAQPRAEEAFSSSHAINASESKPAAMERKLTRTEIKPAAAPSKGAKPPQPEKVAEISHIEARPKTNSESDKGMDSAKEPPVSKSALVNERRDAIRRPSVLTPESGNPPLQGSELALATNMVPALPAPKVSIPAAPTSELVPAELIRRVAPVYPATARQVGLQGTVVLRAQISREGQITNVKVMKGEALLNDAAIRAVRQWRYKPAQLNGSPAESETEIVLNFKIAK